MQRAHKISWLCNLYTSLNVWSVTLLKAHHPACAHSRTGQLTLQRQTGVWWVPGEESQLKISVCLFAAWFGRVGVPYLCRRVECCSTATGAQGCSKWWPGPAAHSQAGTRSSASPQPGKKPFQRSACWWRRRRGSGTARTSQLPGGKKTDANFFYFTMIDTMPQQKTGQKTQMGSPNYCCCQIQNAPLFPRLRNIS